MAGQFKVGDVVKLKSGGPDMTVKYEHRGNYTCQWFAGRKLEDGTFPFDSLVQAQQKSAQ